MQKDFSNFSMKDMAKLANSPEGQKLIALLQQSDTSSLQNAVDQAKSGNYEQAKQILTPLLSSPEIQKIIQQLGEK